MKKMLVGAFLVSVVFVLGTVTAGQASDTKKAVVLSGESATVFQELMKAAGPMNIPPEGSKVYCARIMVSKNCGSTCCAGNHNIVCGAISCEK
jgi:hypothetical protein